MNINFEQLDKIIALAERSNIHSLEVENGDTRIHVVCQQPQSNDTLDVNDTRKPQNLYNSQSTLPPNNATSSNIISTASSDQTELSPSQQISQQDSQGKTSTVIAPMMGTFYLRPEPSATVFFEKGDSVNSGDTLCIIEAMKIMHEVKADKDGVIEEILVDEGDVVEFDQPLFKISPKSS